MPLTNAQLARYRNEGFVVGGRILDDSELARLRAGEYSVHDPWILHGSNPNRSSRRRCGITLKYISTHAAIDRTFVSPSGFDWDGLRLYLARGNPGRHSYVN